MSRVADLSTLRDRIRRIESPERHGFLPFGTAAIDGALPGGGLALGAVHEILGAGGDEEDGATAAGFAAGILARLGPFCVIPGSPAERDPEPRNTGPGPGFTQSCSGIPGSLAPRNHNQNAGNGPARANGAGLVLWCLGRTDLYGPGLLAHGLDPGRLVLVGARRDDEILWAVEEGLRAGPAAGLAAVVGEVGHLPMVAGRRLQLAAERSGVTALLLRRWRTAATAAAERARPSAAVTRWRVTALPSVDIANQPGIGRPRWRVELLRARGGTPCIWDVEIADATGHVSLSAELADRPAAPLWRPAEPRRRAG